MYDENVPGRQVPGDGGRRRRPGWAIVAALAFAGLTSAFMYTLLVPLQAELPRLLNASREDTTWVITITLLAASVATPIAGRLGDLFGKRKIVIALLLLLIIGSAISALSTSIITLIIGRGLQGVATGVIPLGIAIMRDELPPARLGTGVALMSATMGVGAALGLPLSAIVAGATDWHMLFWMAALLGVICLVGIWLAVPRDVVRLHGQLDILGAIGLTIGLTGVLLFISRGAEWGWVSPLALGSLFAGVAVLLIWGWYQLRRVEPLVDLRIAARPAVLLTNLTAFGMGFALFSSNVTFPQLLELPKENGPGFGLTMLEAALCVMPAGLIMMLLSPLSGRLVGVFGPRLLLRVGIGAIVVAYAFVLFFSSEVWHIVLTNAIIGVGIAFAFAAMPMIIMSAVPESETGVSNALNALFRSVGTSGASAAMGGVLAAMSVSQGEHSIPTHEAFVVCFYISLAAALVAAILSLFIPKSPAI